MRKLALLTALCVLSVLALSPAAFARTNRNCGDFSSQTAAQNYFDANRGSSASNFDNLDANHNGTACDNYDYGNVSNTAQQQLATTTPGATGTTTPTAPKLTRSGGPELLIPAVALLLGSGLVTLGLMRRSS